MKASLRQTSLLYILLCISVAFSFFSWKIFYVTVSEWIIVGIFIYNIVTRLSYWQYIKKIELSIMLLFVIYIIGAIVTFVNSDIYLTYGQQFLLPMFHSGIIPLLIFALVFMMTRNQYQSEILLRCVFFSLVGFFLIIFLGFLFGYATIIDDIRVMEGDQLTVNLKLGNLEIATYATWLGAMTTLAFPTLFFFFIRSVGAQKLFWFFFILLDLLVFSRMLTKGGGGVGITTGILVGALATNFYIKEYRKKVILLLLLLVLVIVVGLYCLFDMLPPSGIKAYQSLFEEGINVPNIQFRFLLFLSAYEYALSNIVGMGFNTLWVYYGIDEVNFYSWSANGTGLLGIVSIWCIFIILLFRYYQTLKKGNLTKRVYGVLGLMTLTSIVVAAFGNDKILHMPESVIPFWVIMAVCCKVMDIFYDENPSKTEQ